MTFTDFLWGNEATPERRGMVRVYVAYLRTKLSSSRRVIIRTVRGGGYWFAVR